MAARNLKCKAPVKTVKKTPVTLPKTVLNQVRDGMREASRGLGSLYFEGELLIDGLTLPVSQSSAAEIAKIASLHDFRITGDLLVLRSGKIDRVKDELENLAKALKDRGYNVWRYRISEVMMDSNNFDTLKLL